MAEPLVVVGAGGFGREVVDVIEAINAASDQPAWDLLGIVDDAPAEVNLQRLRSRNLEYLGSVADYLGSGPAAPYVVGVGTPGARRRIVERMASAGLKAATLLHPQATVGSDVVIGDGTIMCAGARVTTNVRLGCHVHINPNATVGHDTTLGDFVSLNPGASVSGDCVIESDVLIGVAGVILNGLTVGSGATVGGAACVVRNVAAGAVVKGVPAR
jgi:sugar O-acyltransferase (sialic acid O-acetyltransferase NeuD family)